MTFKIQPDKKDFLSSIVVFLVALPLCLGVAIASGAPPALGIISGVIGGLVVGSIAGCPLQVTGPAAGLITIVADIVSKNGLESLGVILLLAGIFQILAGYFKLGRWFRAVSPAVIHGMLAGIGVIIFASQFHIMLDDPTKSSGVANLLAIPEAVTNAFSHPDKIQHLLAASLGTLTIVIMLIWEWVPKKVKIIPAPLLAVVLSVAIAALFDFPVKYVDIPANLFSALSFPKPDRFNLLLNANTWISALTIAFVASAETLLTASAVERMTSGKPTINYDREMLAQGVGNTISGFIGALPLTGVIVRSAANVQAGAKTRYSTMMHGFLLLAFALLFPALLAKIPIATLAAVLVYTGYKLVNPKTVQTLWRVSKGEVVIYLLTMIAIVTGGLLEGVILGIVAASCKLLYTFSHLEIDTVEAECQENCTVGQEIEVFVNLKGSATFFNIPKLSEALANIPPNRIVHVQINHLNHIDHACVEMLTNWEKQYNATGGAMKLEWHDLMARFDKSVKTTPEQSAAILKAISSNTH